MKKLIKSERQEKIWRHLRGKIVENLLKLALFASSVWLCLGGLLLLVDAFAI
jgi:hypothetical protein